MLTERDNFLMTLRGECPEWVPSYSIDFIPGTLRPPASLVFFPPVIGEYRNKGGGKNVWGVNFIPTYETGGAVLPEPGNFILEDITKWRDIIKAPDISNIDWEKVSKDHLASAPIDRNETAICYTLTVGFFQDLMAMMGFNEGLMAMFEYPEEVEELFDYICSFYEKVAENCIDYYKPDVLTLMDDTAAWANPFISDDMYRELVLPFHDRIAKFGRDRGLPISMHNCGKCGTLVDDWMSIGINMWDPAQTCNDLVGIKKKYGNSLVLAGGWDARDHLLSDKVTDEEIYESVRKTFDDLAPGGGFMWLGGFLGPIDDEEIIRKNQVVSRAVYELGNIAYK